MTTSDYLTQLQQDRDDLVDNLEAKGITGLTGDETFTELVPEVLNIPSGGGSIDDYLKTTIDWSDGYYYNKGLLKLENIKIGSNVINTSSLFMGLQSLTTLTFSNESDTSNVTSMNYMFRDCYALTSLDLSVFDTSNVTSMNSVFSNCYNLTNLDLSSFNTSKVTNMSYMFSGNRVLPSLNLSNFNTSNVTNMSSMFSECYALTSLDLSSFNTSKVTDMSSMFSACRNLVHLDIRNFTFDTVTSFGSFLGYQGSVTARVPRECEIIVKSQTEKDWFATNFSSYTNVKTVAEYEAE